MSTNKDDDGDWQHLPGTTGLTWVRGPSVEIINGHTVPLRQPAMQAGPGGTLIPVPPPATTGGAEGNPPGGVTRHARDMDAAEYRSAKAAIGRPLPVAPVPLAADAPHARTMTDAEYHAARARVTGRR